LIKIKGAVAANGQNARAKRRHAEATLPGNDPPVEYAVERWPEKQDPFGNPHSAALPKSATPASRSDPMPAAFQLLEAWLQTSRCFVDLWRISARDQQDAVVAFWRAHLRTNTPVEVDGTSKAPPG
jgi:hypothetical protein